MGGCCQRESQQNRVSNTIDYFIRENCKMFNGLILCFMELEEYGAMLKIIKIYKLTKEYYGGNQERRQFLRTESSVIFSNLVEEELKQVNNTHSILQLTLKYILTQLKIPIFTSENEYLQNLLDKYRTCPRFNWVYSMYDKTNRGEWQFEKCVRYLNQGKPMNPSYDSYIREICKTTTYLINNRNTRISYAETTDTQRFDKSRRASVPNRKRELEVPDLKKYHSYK